jgi:hypothetical protein
MSLLNNILNQVQNQTVELDLSKIPVVFLSFDEPNADAHHEQLYNNHPRKDLVKRVHGVVGFDAAHKAAADAAGTDRFFTVDADCLVDKTLWTKALEITPELQKATFSWSSRNAVNGLVYGNGGIKLWYAPYVKNMQTHEAASDADERDNVDFCWDFDNYKQMNNTYGTVYNNASPFQAFRAGFREGIKMCLDRGTKIAIKDFKTKFYPANYSRILTWMTVGRDVENGIWAMYGARMAAVLLYTDKKFNHVNIRDYQWFKEFWDKVWQATKQGELVDDMCIGLRGTLNTVLELPIAELNPEQSILTKQISISPMKNNDWGTLLNASSLPLFGFSMPKWK